MNNLETSEIVIDTDVLVIGGGLAGVFAALKAKEQGVKVALVSKGRIGRSGQTPWATSTFVFPPESEDKLKALVEQASAHGEYVNNRDWTQRVIRESYVRFKDLVAWGIPFLRDGKGEFVKLKIGDTEAPTLKIWATDEAPGSWVANLRNQPQKMGIQIIEKVMVVDLIKQKGVIIGAIGVSTDSWDMYIIKARATVICTGAGGFKPVGGWPIGDLTADGHIMAYRAGAEITGKEFEDFHNGMIRRRGSLMLPPLQKLVNAEGKDVGGFGFGLNTDFEAHAGEAPFYRGKDEVFGNVALGMSIHTAEGIWPVDEYCFSGIPGLYAAGDSCATYVDGAQYGLMGSGTANASVTGARAGTSAAQYAQQSVPQNIGEQELARLKEWVYQPARRKGGFSPNWVTQLIKNAMTPYYILRIKKGDRLQATLTLVEFMRDHLAPKMYARDPHELRLVHETKSMLTNAEMKLRASLFRTESRGTHYREDYPSHVDPDWLAWVMIKEEDGRMKVSKKPVPREWWPDLAKSDEMRYTNRA